MVSEVKVEWYTPGAEEVAYANHLIEKFLVPELKTLSGHASGSLTLTRLVSEWYQLRCATAGFVSSR